MESDTTPQAAASRHKLSPSTTPRQEYYDPPTTSEGGGGGGGVIGSLVASIVGGGGAGGGGAGSGGVSRSRDVEAANDVINANSEQLLSKENIEPRPVRAGRGKGFDIEKLKPFFVSIEEPVREIKDYEVCKNLLLFIFVILGLVLVYFIGLGVALSNFFKE